MILSARTSGRIRRLCTSSISSPQQSLEQCVRGTHVPDHVGLVEMKSELTKLMKSGNLRGARKVFDKMPHRDVYSWTTMISGYVSAMNSDEALILYSTMRVGPDISVDAFVLSVALKACGLSFNVAYGESLHGYSEKSGLVNSVFVGSAILDMYKRIGTIDKSCRVFSEMPVKNVVTWTAIITGLVHAGFYRDGLMYFSKMWRSKVSCDTYTFAIALKACADSGLLKYGKEIHTHVVIRGFDATLCVANSLGTMYIKCGEMQQGLYFFESMNNRDVVSWTSAISAYVQMGQEEKAVDAFLRMRNSGVSPNEFTFASVISACADLSRLVLGEQFHTDVLRLGLEDSLSVANSMMKMYSSCGKLDSASLLFQGMRCRDIISWSTIIGGYCQAGFGEEAFAYFSLMRREGPQPTDFALASVLSVSGTMATLENGMQFHALALNLGLDQRATIRSALMNMYSKCGNITEALKIFEEAESDDIVSLTAMINGYAEHGYGKEAIDLFEKSIAFGFRPDSVAFISVLTACNHSGQLDLGFHYFNLMSEKYNLTPTKDHYGCMIDLLCRAGRLSEAEELIQDMPCQKDDVVWSMLLRACMAKGDVERGKRATEKILKLDPNSATAHVTLAHIYSSRGKWKEAADMWKKMKSKGVMKEPGWSSIKIKDQVSAFVSGDRFHLQSEDIHGILELVAPGAETHELDRLLFPMIFDN
ncbi:PREDICTED: putative pentatricopeptide repeat-containing protein At3g47840 [Tarenaya hassleriana]|uniref:putative pentatricopeptide repeat-containing protein At3g47840 n=1 Tax=Tarenaya hassleriana TaxID=28532 RepID=UPI00053C7BF9|nr:PREDICTED: putative pentatricopeptide repeat-containing protein At3g47840 [Tarenaya hassleriana]